MCFIHLPYGWGVWQTPRGLSPSFWGERLLCEEPPVSRDQAGGDGRAAQVL